MKKRKSKNNVVIAAKFTHFVLATKFGCSRWTQCLYMMHSPVGPVIASVTICMN